MTSEATSCEMSLSCLQIPKINMDYHPPLKWHDIAIWVIPHSQHGFGCLLSYLPTRTLPSGRRKGYAAGPKVVLDVLGVRFAG